MGLESEGKGKLLFSQGALSLEIPLDAAALVLLSDGSARTITPDLEGEIPHNSEVIGLFLWILSSDALLEVLFKEFRLALASGRDDATSETLEKIKAAMRGEVDRDSNGEPVN